MIQRRKTVLQTDASIKDLEPVYSRMDTLSILQVSHYKMQNVDMLERVRSLSSIMGNGEIPSFLICLTVHFRNWSEAIRNHPHKELDRSNTAITMTSYTYLPLWLYSHIHKRVNQPISRLSFQTWLPERQDRATKTEDSCHNQAITCHSRQIESVPYWNCPRWRIVTFQKKSNLTGPSMKK